MKLFLTILVIACTITACTGDISSAEDQYLKAFMMSELGLKNYELAKLVVRSADTGNALQAESEIKVREHLRNSPKETQIELLLAIGVLRDRGLIYEDMLADYVEHEDNDISLQALQSIERIGVVSDATKKAIFSIFRDGREELYGKAFRTLAQIEENEEILLMMLDVIRDVKYQHLAVRFPWDLYPQRDLLKTMVDKILSYISLPPGPTAREFLIIIYVIEPDVISGESQLFLSELSAYEDNAGSFWANQILLDYNKRIVID